MATKTREQLKNYFKTGDVPSQSDFGDLIDSLATTSELSSGLNLLRTLLGIASEVPQEINRGDDIFYCTDNGEFVYRVGDAVPRASFNCVVTDADLSDQSGVQLLNSPSSPIKLYKCTSNVNFTDNTDVTEITMIWLGLSNVAATGASRLMKADLRAVKTLTSGRNHTFRNCIALREVRLPSVGNTQNASSMFFGCSSLVRAPRLNMPLLKTFSYAFYNCNQLVEIPYLDVSSATEMITPFFGCSSLVYLNVVGLGTQSTLTSLNIAASSNLGSTEAARMALVDTLLTNSFDRAAAGYPTFTVTLHADAKARLTADEIAQITAKGFTIA